MTKDEYKTAIKNVIYLSSCAVKGEMPNRERVNGMNLAQLYFAAAKHQLVVAVAFALESAGVTDASFSQAKFMAIRKLMLMDADMNRLFTEMEQAGIWYMPLKGAVLKDDYPEFGMRQMADRDILFDASRAEEVKSIMEGMGYTSKYFGSSDHDCYYKEPVYNFEMHRVLFGSNHEAKLQDYFRRVKSRLIKDDGKNYGYHFSPEDFYIYMIAHEYKHYTYSGTGLRSLLDTYVYLTKHELDMGYVAKEVGKLGITDYEACNRSLAMHLFRKERLSESERKMLHYIVYSGAYGTLDHFVGNTMKKKHWNTLDYVLNRFSVPVSKKNKNYTAYAVTYPFFYKHKIFLPLLPFYRAARAMKAGRFVSEAKAIRNAKRKP